MERQPTLLEGARAGAPRRPKAVRAALRFMSPKWHGVVDYGAAAALLLAPLPLGFASTAPAALGLSVAAGVLLVVYSLLTDYDLGAARVLSFRTHLALDLAAGFALLAAPVLLGFDGVARAYFVVMGLSVFGAVAVTDPNPAPTGEGK